MAKRHVWEDFDVDDDPTAFPDPFAAKPTHAESGDAFDTAAAKRADLFGFRVPEERADEEGEDTTLKSPIKKYGPQGKAPPSASSSSSSAPFQKAGNKGSPTNTDEAKWGPRSTREVSFLVPGGQGPAETSTESHNLSVHGGPRKPVTEDKSFNSETIAPQAGPVLKPTLSSDHYSSGTSSYNGTRGRTSDYRAPALYESNFRLPQNAVSGLPHRVDSLPLTWRVPESDTYKGYVYRLKGHWKKQWAKEMFTIQHNVLLICPKESPLLVKHCIPLTNILRISPDTEDPMKFSIQYLAPLRKARTKPEEIFCKTETSEECAIWVTRLSDAQRRALQRRDPIGDFVERDAAETAIKKAYKNLHGASRHVLINVLTQLFTMHRERDLREAFNRWRSILQAAKLRLADQKIAQVEDEVKERTKRLESDLKVAETKAKKERIVYMAIDKLKTYQKGLLHFSLLRLKRNADAAVTDNMVSGAAAIMQFNWRRQAEFLATDLVKYRTRKLCHTLGTMRSVRLRLAFDRLRVYGQLRIKSTDFRDRALYALVEQQAQDRLAAKRVIFEIWRQWDSYEYKREEGLLMAIKEEKRRLLSGVLKRWLNGALTIKLEKETATQRLVTVTTRVEARQMGAALRRLALYAQQEGTLDAVQVATNFGLLNAKLVKSFVQVPMHKGCLTLANFFIRARDSRFLHVITMLKINAAGRSYYLKATCVLVGLLSAMEKRKTRNRLIAPFHRLRHNGIKSVNVTTMRRLALQHIDALIKSSLIVSKGLAFGRWRTNAMLQNVNASKAQWFADLHRVIARGRMSKAEIFAEQCSYWLTKLTKRRLFLGIRRLQVHAERCTMIRSMARIYCLQRVAQLIDRLRVARLTQAWDVLRAEFGDTAKYYGQQVESTLSKVQQSEFVTRVIKSRRDVQSRLLQTAPDVATDELFGDTAGVSAGVSGTETPSRIIQSAHSKKVRSLLYKPLQPTFKKKPLMLKKQMQKAAERSKSLIPSLLKTEPETPAVSMDTQSSISSPESPVTSPLSAFTLSGEGSPRLMAREDVSAAVRRALDEAERFLHSTSSRDSLGSRRSNASRASPLDLAPSSYEHHTVPRPHTGDTPRLVSIGSTTSFVEAGSRLESTEAKPFVTANNPIVFPSPPQSENISGISSLSDFDTILSELAGMSSSGLASPAAFNRFAKYIKPKLKKKRHVRRVTPNDTPPVSRPTRPSVSRSLDELSNDDFNLLKDVLDTETGDWRLLQDFLSQQNVVYPASNSNW